MATWIDFKELRQKLDFKAVLQHYGVELKLKANGKQHQGFCPLPTHDGQKNSPSFSANLERNIWQCFGCGAKGNVIDFATRMEGLDPATGADFRKTALKLQEKFLPDTIQTPTRSKVTKEVVKPDLKQVSTPVTKNNESATAAQERRVEINAPLDFALQGLDVKHPYLVSRGFTAETITEFGLGFCARGLMAGRIAIPLHDSAGKLIGYAGRLVDDSSIDEEYPKYKLPGKREREGIVHEFHKSLFVYNGHRITKPVDDLIVVEGFPSVWWLWQAGLRNVVGLMGSSCSHEQAQIIANLVSPNGRVWLFPDGDDAGTRCAETVFAMLGPHRFTRWVKLDNRKQPTDCSPNNIAALLGRTVEGAKL